MSILRDSKQIGNAGDVIRRDIDRPVRTPPAAVVAAQGLTTPVASPAHPQALLDRADVGGDSCFVLGDISLAVTPLNADAVACPRDSLRLSNVEGEARDRVGRLVGKSGRHLQRLFRVLLTPVPIQHAVRDGRLPMVMGEKVEGLPKNEQAKIAQRITAGEDPRAVVAQYVVTGNGRHRKAADAFRSFTKHLEGRTDQVYRKENKDALPLFDRVADLLTRLRREATKSYVDTPGLAEIAKAMSGSHASAED